MGPHSFECGNSRKKKIDQVPEYVLQWGRTRSSAEIYSSIRPCRNPDSGFNGTALVRVRKLG